MTLDDATLQRLSQLIDEAIDLDEAAWQVWLDGLQGEESRLAPILRGMLEKKASLETTGLLGRGPAFTAPGGLAEGGGFEYAAGDRIGPYVLLRELGRGGMGEVWLAERADGQLKRPVALKLPLLNGRRQALEQRFARERDILGALEHPHIARLYDAGVSEAGQPFLALEYVDGKPLDVYCRDGGLGVAQRLELLLQVAGAVAFAHSRLVIHRDLKPSNIMVTAEGEVRLLDFGIAKLMEGETAAETALTRAAGRALTLHYASPEQIRGEPIGTASDVYSLAVVAYELLAGSRPYRLKRGSAAELEEAIAAAEAPLASDMAVARATKKRLRGDLDAILNKGLKKAAAERYPTVEAMAQDLQRHLHCEPVLARPDRLGYRTRRFVRRHLLAVVSAAAVAVALVSGTGVALWQARQARLEAARADAETSSLEMVGNFLLGTMSRIAADPSVAQGRKAMAAAVRREVADVEARNVGKDKGLAAVYGNAAATYTYLQSPKESLEFALKELAHLKRAGDFPVRIAEAERQIALGYYRAGGFDEALRHLEAGRALLAGDTTEGGRVMRSRLWRAAGMYLFADYRLDESKPALEAARRELEPDLRADGHYYGSATIEYAKTLHALGEDSPPLALLDETRGIYATLPGLAESESANLQLARAEILAGLGRYADAEAALRESATLYAKQFGSDGPNAANVEFGLISILSRQGKYDAARAMLQRVKDIFGHTIDVGPGSRLGLRFLKERFDIELEHGDLTAAADALALLQAQAPASAARTDMAMADAKLAAARGLNDVARRALVAADSFVKGSPYEAPRAARALALQAAAVELRAGDAVAARRRLEPVPLPSEGADDWTLWAAADLRAEADVAQGRTAAALAWYRSPLAQLQGRASVRRPPRDEVLARLAFARALRAEGQATPAEEQLVRVRSLLATQHAESPLRSMLRPAP